MTTEALSVEEQAKAEEEASKAAMESLEDPLVSIRRCRGIGPLIVPSRRGDTKAFSGDVIVKIAEKAAEGEDEEGKKQRYLKAEEIIFTESQFLALHPDLTVEELPDDLEFRMARLSSQPQEVAPPAEPEA